mgnify:CR=1 FL=1
MTERGFHPFAVLHFLRKTILLYLLPLLQVLFARNWAALRTALVQGAALLTKWVRDYRRSIVKFSPKRRRMTLTAPLRPNSR